jgi:hypothetical protein
LKKKTLKRLTLNKETILELKYAVGGLEGDNAAISDSCRDNGAACGPVATTNLSGGRTCSPCY